MALQKQEHEDLVANCEKILESHEAALQEIAKRDLQAAENAEFGPESESLLARWANPANNTEPSQYILKKQALLQQQQQSQQNQNSNSDDGKGIGKKKSKHNIALPKESIAVMKAWLYAHVDNPYPTQADKDLMSEETGLTVKQINNWFINARRRYLAGDKKRRRGGHQNSSLDEDW